MQVKVADTKCGAIPGPHCLGCYAHGTCGSDDATDRDMGLPETVEEFYGGE